MQNKRIILYPMGPVDSFIIDYLSERVSFHLGLSCKTKPGINIPHEVYNKVRDQYDAKLILKYLLTLCDSGTLRVVGITQVDLFVPILKYVFGLSQIEGPCAVISTHRLYPQFYKQPMSKHLLLERAEKTMIHELGHSFGLTHCRNRKCVMYSSVRIADTDRKEGSFCATCYELFKWRMNGK